MGCLRSCFGSAVSLVLLVVVGYVGWRWGEPIFTRAQAMMDRGSDIAAAAPEGDDSVSVSMATGRDALDRVEELQRGPAGTEIRLSGNQLQSILQYSIPGLVPAGVIEPSVQVRSGQLQATARIAGAQLGEVPELLSKLGAISDTVDVEFEGTLVPYASGAVSLVIDGMRVGGIPVLSQLIPRTLDAMGRDRHEDLPNNAILTPLPDGLGSAWIRGDSLVLVAGGV